MEEFVRKQGQPLPTYIQNSPFPITVKGLLERMEFAGVDMSVIWIVCPANSSPRDICKANDFVSDTVKKHSDRFLGFANVHPPHGKEAIGEIDRAVKKLDLRGIKIHPMMQRFKMNDPSVIPVLKKAQELDLPVVFHVAGGCGSRLIPETLAIPSDLGLLMQDIADHNDPFSRSRFLADIIPQYNSKKVLAAHMGGIYSSEISTSKISFQTNGCSVAAIEYAYTAVGPERIVFGSDFGGANFDVAPEIAKVARARIPNEAKAKILGENAKEILRL